MNSGGKELSPQRKRVVALCAGVACMAGGPVLLKGHPILIWCWITVMVLLLVFAMVQFEKLKKRGL
jgi:Flp pilus assembly protein TadB